MASLGEELLGIVNRLQDLVFNTIGNDSLDLPQIVRHTRNNSFTHTKTASRWSLVRSRPESRPFSKTSSAEIFFPEEVAL